MGFKSPNYTQIPNDLLGQITGRDTEPGMMADMEKSELKVVLAVCRLTFGFHRKKARASLSDIMTMTGLSRQGVLDGAAAAETREIICRYTGSGVTEWEAITTDTGGQGIRPVESPVDQDGLTTRPVESPAVEPVLVQPLDQSGLTVRPVEPVLVQPLDQSGLTVRPVEPVLVQPLDQSGLMVGPPTIKEKKLKENKEKESSATVVAEPETGTEPVKENSEGEKRQPTGKNAVKLELEGFFSEITQLPRPLTNTAKRQKAAGATWWKPLLDMADACDGDIARTKEMIRWAVEKLDADGLTVSSPKSICQTALAEQARRKRNGGNGHAGNSGRNRPNIPPALSGEAADKFRRLQRERKEREREAAGG